MRVVVVLYTCPAVCWGGFVCIAVVLYKCTDVCLGRFVCVAALLRRLWVVV
jgi:hypothetical protein